ncbi:MAG: hypothetical protein AAF269_02715 [Pseudomonadota bacterium]
MFKNQTIVLVGAGASAEFGLGTGVGLFEAAAKEDEKLTSKGGELADRLFHSFWEFIRFNNMHGEQEAFRKLVAKLKESHSQSIDLFAYNNPSFANIAKLYTAWNLIRDLYLVSNERTHDGRAFKRVSHNYNWRSPKVGTGENLRNNWIGELANLFLGGAANSADLANNKLMFVTFNYDMILEETFPWIVRSQERYADTPDELLPEIIHLHGQINRPKEDQLNKLYFEEQASNIKFISDTLGAPSENVSRARSALANADRVYSIGFAFEELNANLLAAGQWGRKTVALNFDGNTKVTNAMKRVGVSESNIWSGSDTIALPAGLAASRGFFDARPII